jgi:3-mercaptopyruvate sulfurtransferase SseA
MGNNIDVVDYNYVKTMANQPEKFLVDVRNPDELEEAGKIPHSINIPCMYQKLDGKRSFGALSTMLVFLGFRY